MAHARERGITLEAYLNELVRKDSGATVAAPLSGKERANAFLAWAQAHRPTPPLSDGAVSRASLYPYRP
jgi:hypothetical protein